MKALKSGLCFFIILMLTACSDVKLKNFTAFIDSYNQIAVTKLYAEDFFFYNNSDDTLRTFIGDSEIQVILSLKEDNKGKIESCKATLAKDAVATLPKEQVRDVFCRALSRIIKAYCSFDDKTAYRVIEAFSLNNYDSIYKTGELTTKINNYYFVYYSNEVTSELMIFDTYLYTVETTEKPVSRPYYGEDFIEKE